MSPQELYRQERAKRQAPAVSLAPARVRTPYKRYSTTTYRCGDARAPENTYTNRVTLVTACLTCRRRRSARKLEATHA